MQLDQAALDEHCNAVVDASNSLTKGDDASPLVEVLNNLAKAAGDEFSDEVGQLVNVIDAIDSDAAIVNKADVIYDTVVEFREAILAKAETPTEGVQPDELDVMLGALGKSVMSILDVAPEANKEDLLAKSFDQFADAAKSFVGTVAESSFDAGLNTDIAKMDGNGELAKGMNHVAGFALLLRQVEYFLETWADEVDEEAGEGDPSQGGGSEPPKGLMAAAQWYQLGQEVLKVLVQNATGDDSQDDGQGDPGQDDGAQADSSQGAPQQQPPQQPPQQPHAQHQAPPKRPPFGKSDNGGDLAKRLDDIAAENEDLRKQVAAIRNAPAPAKGAVFGVPKGRDAALAKGDADSDLMKKAEELAKLPPEQRALEMMKMLPATQVNF